MTVTCGLVCSVNKTRYLNVKPETIFLMPGNNFTDNVLVMSNVDWKVQFLHSKEEVKVEKDSTRARKAHPVQVASSD